MASPPLRIAFHAPMKPASHPTPSGDRRIARLTLQALERAGFAPFVASELRTLDMAGAPLRQAALEHRARDEAARLIGTLRPDPPALWLTYHSYWKAPDLLGPKVARGLGIPYVVTEPIVSRRRRAGPWAGFAAAAEAGMRAADLLLWSTPRDRPGLDFLGHDRLAELPPFVDPGPPPAPRVPYARSAPLRLLVAAMMRPGDKAASYARLAAGLAALPASAPDWRLDILGDGPARTEVEAMFAPLAPRVRFRGAVSDPAETRAAMETADLLPWPGVGEGFGMVYLEAQAAGLPCLAENRPGPAHVLAPEAAGGLPLTDPATPVAYAAGLAAALASPERLVRAGAAARAHILARHGIDAAAARLRARLLPLIEGAPR
ncbi:MAG: glycosyl transferase [Rhodobacteraceae bacterium]|nr:glycosyl transferase [Paracoccaceae bacterium]